MSCVLEMSLQEISNDHKVIDQQKQTIEADASQKAQIESAKAVNDDTSKKIAELKINSLQIPVQNHQNHTNFDHCFKI